ncbi:GNAT family N-acetyltransferase [Erysipelothrix anatis]|uniref:GNAT family N-acetyltransferase n=1 Tax=Erysipelothrix anatis TaxID=2683713 RepID=UPI001357955A|nr:GNAT family N-acetyltransferase [Erysipelothrix anatis]
MNLENFTVNDLDAYIALASEFHSGPASFTPPNISVFTRNFEYILNSSDAYGWFIKVDGTIAGYVLCSRMFSTEIGAPQLWIEELSILDSHQGQGLGSAVLDQLQDMFPNMQRFRLEVAPANESAKRLYKRKGYDFIAYEQMIIDRK